MLEVVDLSKRYGGQVALDGCGFQVEPGRLTGFLGPNGAGKTTAMRCVMGLVQPDRGQVLWQGRPVRLAERLRFGYMPEERGLYPRMGVREQLVYLGQLAGLERRAASGAAERWLDRLDLVEHLCQDVVVVHHGRVVLAGVLEELRAAARRRVIDLVIGNGDGWTPRLGGVEVAERGPGHLRLWADPGVDPAEVLAQARAHGPVTRLAWQPPSLSELFKGAVR